MATFQLVVILVVASIVPVVIFFSARTIAEWVIGSLLLLALLLYYAQSITTFLDSNNHTSGFFQFLSSILLIYRGFVLSHWPSFRINILRFTLFSMNANYEFSTTWWPLIVLGASGLIRLVVGWFVRHTKLKEVTAEYWLYITSLLILLLTISSISNWNFFITLLIFFITLIFIATGLYRILSDILLLILEVIKHIWTWTWIGLNYLAVLAIKVAKIINSLFSKIKELYNKYVRGPFQHFHRAMVEIEQQSKLKATKLLDDERLESNS
jgi:hypothetical protein